MHEPLSESTDDVRVRPFEACDHESWARMRSALWPDQTPDDMARWLATDTTVTLVAVLPDGTLCGFVEVDERPFAEGCETSPVAYVEGLYVEPEARRRGVAVALLYTAERWARDRGYREIASDADPENVASHRTHVRAGFFVAGRAVLYARRLS